MKRRVLLASFAGVVALLIPDTARAQEGPACEPEPTDQTIVYGEQVSSCNISGSGDIDLFRFDGVSGEVVEIRGAGPFIRITLLRPDASTVVSNSSSSGGVIRTTLDATGLFTVLVSSSLGAPGYNFQVHRLMPVSPSAVAIDPGETFNGERIAPKGDADLFIFRGVSGDAIILQGTGPFVRIELLRPDASTVANNSSSTGGTINTTLDQSGLFTVIVTSSLGSPSYTLQYLCLVGTCPPTTTDLGGDGYGDTFIYDPSLGGWAFQNSNGVGGFTGAGGGWSAGWSVTPALFNQDALTDAFLFNPTTGQWFKMLNSGGSGFTVEGSGTWGSIFQRHVVDLNGDRLSDIFLYEPGSGVWFQCLATTGGFNCTQGFWAPGWEIYPAFLNQDARQDFFLFDRSSGLWFKVLSTGTGFTYPDFGFWGTGWTFHLADYDGDHLTDVLLFDDTTGQWFIATTELAGFTYTSGFFSLGWDFYMVDLDADHSTDLFMHNPATGQWFELISDSAGGFTVGGSGFWTVGWSLSMVDLNGDRRTDIVLYDPTTGLWFQARNLMLGDFSYSFGFWSPGLTIIPMWLKP